MNDGSHIKVKNLNVYFDDDQILKNINLEIPDKKITAIIGPSGCGKTTLLKTFNSMISINSHARVTGEVLIDGENIYDKNIEITSIRKKMGLLLQKPYPLPMSIFDNVAYGPKIHGIREKSRLNEIVIYHLKEVNLWDEVKNRLNEPATSLSVGQQQRLCLARGLAIEPEIILGDEPTSSLDPISSKKIEEKFLQLKDSYTIILVTHILRQAKRLADYIVFLYLGELIEHGSSKEFFENPKNKLTREYVQGMIS
jgi:phosphate transport system ATP-binding protein